MNAIRRFGLLCTWLSWLAWCPPPLQGLEPAPQKYALLIGLNSQLYEGVQVQSLKYATDDVIKLKEVLEQPAYGFKVWELRDPRATREDIVGELRHFARIVKEQDTFLLYFAGHGVRDTTNGQTYLLTYKASLLDLDVHAIRLRHLLEYVREIPAKRKLIILDHCYSGDIIATLDDGAGRGATGTSRDAGTPLSAERSLVPRDLPPEAISGALRLEGAGLTVLAASRGAAYELDPPIGHGLFTSVLVKALTTREADTKNEGATEGDRKLSVNELASYVKAQIKDKSSKLGLQQEPLEWMEGQNLDSWFLGDLPAEIDRQLDKINLYRSTLTSWRGRSLISQTTALHCFTVLSNWREALQAGTIIGPGIVRVLAALDDAMNTAFPERSRAEYLETTVQGLLQGGNQ